MAKLTEMQQFALDKLKREKKDVSANGLAHDWAVHKTGRARVSSRDRFGYTSASYRTMRKLVELGLAEHAGYSRYNLKPE
jgi:hypothetical protein